MAQNEIVEVSATSNDRKTNRRVLVASLSIQKVRLNIYQDADPAMIENLIKLLVDHASYLDPAEACFYRLRQNRSAQRY